MIDYMIGYIPRGQPQGWKNEGPGVSRSEYQKTTVKSGDREGLTRGHRESYSILPQDKREGARVAIKLL